MCVCNQTDVDQVGTDVLEVMLGNEGLKSSEMTNAKWSTNVQVQGP